MTDEHLPETISTEPNSAVPVLPLRDVVVYPAIHPQVSGARGLRTILEDVLLDTMYELPGLTNVTKVVVDEAVVVGETKPYMMYESDDSTVLPEEQRPTGST